MGFIEEPKVDQLREIAEAVVKDNFLELSGDIGRMHGRQPGPGKAAG
jgi:hypothetical protein